MTQRIMVFLKKHYTDNSDLVNLRNLICSSLHTAAQQAAHIDPSTNSGVCPGRSQKFFTVLRSSLQGLGFLEDRLPDPENASAMFNIDSCGLVELQDIAAHVEESLPYESLPSVTHTPFCIVTETFRLRCKELCPMCRIRCAHPSGDGHSGLHMSAHQPGGLGGTHECVSLMIDPDSCLQSAAKNATIRLSGSDKRVPFRDFTTAFPTWEVPPWNQPAPIPMLVRQYIFFHKQDLLHEMHPHTVKCLDRMPKSYNCDLELLRSTIRAELERDGVQDLDSI
ncbi:hypothetical protein Pelo_10781 [Pelomyxa schiedti]|nr:hypothetical protein Pelo_10781 [Pelomyxa schiedti]